MGAPVEITAARKRLEEMRDELDRSISILQGEDSGSLAGGAYPHDSADAGAYLTEADRTEAMLSSARGQRAEVLAALSRIEDSTYGLCVDCGQQIPEGRIEARPDAARCVGCQAKHAPRRR
jgi:DnaK suppressor protein